MADRQNLRPVLLCQPSTATSAHDTLHREKPGRSPYILQVKWLRSTFFFDCVEMLKQSTVSARGLCCDFFFSSLSQKTPIELTRFREILEILRIHHCMNTDILRNIYKVSIGLRSGLWKGHSERIMLACFHSKSSFAVCLSCLNI